MKPGDAVDKVDSINGVEQGGRMSELIPKHGGYRRLQSFQVAQLVYDVTVRFCDKYISKRSRTHDQMVQAARSGVQNIAEGSQASATSKKTELKLFQRHCQRVPACPALSVRSVRSVRGAMPAENAAHLLLISMIDLPVVSRYYALHPSL